MTENKMCILRLHRVRTTALRPLFTPEQYLLGSALICVAHSNHIVFYVPALATMWWNLPDIPKIFWRLFCFWGESALGGWYYPENTAVIKAFHSAALTTIDKEVKVIKMFTQQNQNIYYSLFGKHGPSQI